MKKTTAGGIALLFLFLSFTLITGDNEQIKKDNEIFSAFFSDVHARYVDELMPDDVLRAAIDGALHSLDPYSYFISEKDQETNKKGWKGILFGGIGINIIQRDSEIVVVEVNEHYPAQTAGLRHGDLLLAANDTSLHGMSTDSVVTHLRGAAGTTLKLKIGRADTSTFEIALTRQEIRNKPVTFSGMLNDSTGYIRFVHFLENSSVELRDAIQKLKAENNMISLILDIRGNTGGLLLEAVNAVNIFIPKNKNVTSLKGKAKEWNYDNPTLQEPLDTVLPLVLLTDNYSISAAEILAGAIQDYDRGIIVGRKTFGKGFVQGTRGLPYGNSLYMTSARYYTPSGRCIQELDYRKKDANGKATHLSDSLKKEFHTSNGRIVHNIGGITPDISVEEKIEPAVITSLKKGNLFFDFANSYRNSHPVCLISESREQKELLYKEFVTFIASKNFPFSIPSEDALILFAEKAKVENSMDAVSGEFKRLKESLRKNKRTMLAAFKSEIILELEKEIRARYQFNSGRIRVSLKTDPDVLKALSIVKDQNSYDSLLHKRK